MGRALTLCTVIGLAWLAGDVLALNMRARNIKKRPFDPSHDHLLVFQYGKVGSSSLEVSLGSLMRPPSRLHIIGDIQQTYPRGAKMHNTAVARDMLSHIPAESDVWVITMTRSPLHKAMSGYFQNIDKHFTRDHVLHNMTIEDLQEDFRQRVHGSPVFFTNDFFNVTGVNMVDYADEFAKGSGSHNHIFVKHRSERNRLNLNILLLRFEDIQTWDSTFGEYFPGFQMEQQNVGEEKWYADVYRKFVKTYTMMQDEKKHFCGSDTMNFYSIEEQHALVPECDPKVSVDELDRIREACQLEEAGKLYIKTSNAHLLLADLSVDGFDSDNM